MLELIDILSRHRTESKTPIVIHCSAGIGRTGTLIALYFLKSIIDNQRKSGLPVQASIFATVMSIREQRFNSVETTEQYAFIYEFVSKYLAGELA